MESWYKSARELGLGVSFGCFSSRIRQRGTCHDEARGRFKTERKEPQTSGFHGSGPSEPKAPSLETQSPEALIGDFVRYVIWVVL